MFGFGRKAVEKKPSKIGGLFGFMMFLSAGGTLAWNESRTASMENALLELEKTVQTAQIQPVSPALEGKPIHLTGQAETEQGVADPYFEFGSQQRLVLHRQVEMYQWVKHRKNKRDEWRQEWSDDEESGSGDHDNPPFPLRAESFAASDAHLGAFQLSDSILTKISFADNYLIPTELPQARAEEGWVSADDALFLGKGSENSPAIGDVRVIFNVLDETQISLIGTQRGNTVEAFVAKNGYDLLVLKTGNSSAKAMITEEKSDNSTLGNILRAVGGGGMALGLGMAFSGFVGWLTWIPLLGPAIERFAFWTGALLGGILAFILFVGAWLWAHPLVFIGILALGSAAAVAWGLKKRGEPQFATAMPPPMQGGAMGPPAFGNPPGNASNPFQPPPNAGPGGPPPPPR